MAKKSNGIEINNLGECVMHLQAVVIYLDGNYKKTFRSFLFLIFVGFILGFGWWSSLKTVNLKEIPLGMANSPFTLYAGEKEGFKVDEKSGTIFYAGKEIGTLDSNFQIYKLRDKDMVVIHNKKTGRAYMMELELK